MFPSSEEGQKSRGRKDLSVGTLVMDTAAWIFSSQNQPHTLSRPLRQQMPGSLRLPPQLSARSETCHFSQRLLPSQPQGLPVGDAGWEPLVILGGRGWGPKSRAGPGEAAWKLGQNPAFPRLTLVQPLCLLATRPPTAFRPAPLPHPALHLLTSGASRDLLLLFPNPLSSSPGLAPTGITLFIHSAIPEALTTCQTLPRH